MTANTRSIKLGELAGGATHLVTPPEFRDVHPSGTSRPFLSYRTFDPVYDSLYFDLGFPKTVLPYPVTLSAEEPSPFVSKPKGLKPDKPPEPSPTADGEQELAEPIRVDVEGIGERVVAFPVPLAATPRWSASRARCCARGPSREAVLPIRAAPAGPSRRGRRLPSAPMTRVPAAAEAGLT